MSTVCLSLRGDRHASPRLMSSGALLDLGRLRRLGAEAENRELGCPFESAPVPAAVRGAATVESAEWHAGAALHVRHAPTRSAHKDERPSLSARGRQRGCERWLCHPRLSATLSVVGQSAGVRGWPRSVRAGSTPRERRSAPCAPSKRVWHCARGLSGQVLRALGTARTLDTGALRTSPPASSQTLESNKTTRVRWSDL